MEQTFEVKYLDPAGPARNFKVPSKDFFKFSKNNTIGIILADDSVVFLPLGEVETIKTYLAIPGDSNTPADPNSRVCEITGDDNDVIILKLAQPLTLGNAADIPSDCCTDAGVDDMLVTIQPALT